MGLTRTDGDTLLNPWVCLKTAIWRCRKPFSQWQHSFHRKLPSHWLKFLRQRHVAVVRQGPGLCFSDDSCSIWCDINVFTSGAGGNMVMVSGSGFTDGVAITIGGVDCPVKDTTPAFVMCEVPPKVRHKTLLSVSLLIRAGIIHISERGVGVSELDMSHGSLTVPDKTMTI